MDSFQLVSFHLDKKEYGVEVPKVREIIRMADITARVSTGYAGMGKIDL